MVKIRQMRRKRDDVRDWLLAFLSRGPRPSLAVMAAGKDRRFSRDTIFRARKEMGERICIEKNGLGGWYWRLLPNSAAVVPPPPLTSAGPVRPPHLSHWWHHML